MVPGPEFDEFYAAAYGALVRQLYVVVGDLDEAEDLVQEAFAMAAAQWQRLRGYDVPEAMALAIPTHQGNYLHHALGHDCCGAV